MKYNCDDFKGKLISYNTERGAVFAEIIDIVTGSRDRLWLKTGRMAIKNGNVVRQFKEERLLLYTEVIKNDPKIYGGIKELNEELFLELIRTTGEINSGVSLASRCIDEIDSEIRSKFKNPKRRSWLDDMFSPR